MGFLTGVITGIAGAVLAAAWYLSRSGHPFRQRYRVEERLARLGDELDVRSRDIRIALDRQLGELRGASDAETSATAAALDGTLDGTLDPVAASAAEAEAAAVLEAGVDDSAADAPTKRSRKPKSAAADDESAPG